MVQQIKLVSKSMFDGCVVSEEDDKDTFEVVIKVHARKIETLELSFKYQNFEAFGQGILHCGERPSRRL